MKKKNDYPVDFATFLINIQPQGFVKDISFLNIPLKMTADSVRIDFFGTEAIDKFKDLSTVNYKNKVSRRDRAIALVGYDSALRISELLDLRIQDLSKGTDGEWMILIKSDGQKGTKPEVMMYFFFPETIQILEEYLAVRGEFDPKCDRLFVSNTGGPLGESYGNQFKRHCLGIGVRTYYGKIGTPHHLRHSFATLNIHPLGLALSLDDMVKRLRHIKYETAQRHYIHDNPYLNKMKHDFYRNGAKKKTNREILNEVPWADYEHLMSDDWGVDPSTIAMLRSKHKKASVKASGNGSDNVVISESEAFERLKHLSIPRYALRKFSLEKGVCSADGKKDLCRYGKNFRYSESFIEDLANNWAPAKELMAKLKNITERDFYKGLKERKWRNVKIGKTRYLYKADCL